MPGWVAALTAWWRLPVRGGFAELDLQIAKLRMLRDSYQIPLQQSGQCTTTAHDKSTDKRLCVP